MARPVLLGSAGWADLPLEELTLHIAEWGYQGLDLCCWGDHFEVQRAISEPDYCPAKLALLNRQELIAPVLSVHRVSQAVSDRIEARHSGFLPDYVWGDGQPQGVQQRAVEELLATARAAQQLGVTTLSGYSGSSLWPSLLSYPPPTEKDVAEAFEDFARLWHPILDVMQECGLRYALQVQPGQMAFDLISAEQVLEAINNRQEFGFTLEPAALHWQGIDPTEFIRRFGERIFHVQVTDLAYQLNGRTSLLSGHLPPGDVRRGWDYRSPGRGSLDWETLLRALNEVGYDGPLAVTWQDPSMNREFGAEEARRFVQRLDFEAAPRPDRQAFR